MGSWAVVEREGLGTWPEDLEELPERVDVTGAAGLVVHGYPALVDLARSGTGSDGAKASADGGKRAADGGRSGAAGPVAVRVLGDPDAAANAHRRGLLRLLVADVGLPTQRITTRWSASQALELAASPYPSTEALVGELQLAAAGSLLERLLPEHPAVAVRSARAYAELRAEVRDRLEDEVYAVAGLTARALAKAREVDATLRASTSLALLSTCTDIRAHLDSLVFPGFLTAASASRLGHLPRYLEADLVRLAKAAESPAKDSSLAWQVAELAEEVAQVRAAVVAAAPGPESVAPGTLAALEDVRWMLEELRVSLFAQQLGTAGSVSPQRIRKALAKVPR